MNNIRNIRIILLISSFIFGYVICILFGRFVELNHLKKLLRFDYYIEMQESVWAFNKEKEKRINSINDFYKSINEYSDSPNFKDAISVNKEKFSFEFNDSLINIYIYERKRVIKNGGLNFFNGVFLNSSKKEMYLLASLNNSLDNTSFVSSKHSNIDLKDIEFVINKFMTEVSDTMIDYYFYNKKVMFYMEIDSAKGYYRHTIPKHIDYLSEKYLFELKLALDSILRMNDVKVYNGEVLIPAFSPVPPPNY